MHQVDMHLHSSFSPDAEHSPTEVVKIAKRIGVKGIVITDHNLISGTSESLRATQRYHLDTCCGVEISTKYCETDFHILGYATMFRQDILARGLAKTIAGYNERCREIVQKCKEKKIADIDFDKLLKKKRNSYLTRRDIAEEIARIRKISYQEAFKFIDRGGGAFVSYGEWAMLPEEAIQLIREAGG